MAWLEGRTAVVTGGAGGIGSEICQELAAEGAAVAVWDLDGDRAEALAAGIPRATAHRVDITDSADVDRVTAEVRDRHGTIDTLINNAGISKVGDHTHELSDEIWNESIAVMQTGVFFCSRAVGRVMIGQGRGTVVNISSIRGYSANPGRLGYCAAKAAVIIMTEVMAGEWGPLGIRVNAIAPGYFPTEMTGLLEDKEQVAWICAHTALGRPAEISELDGTLLFLATRASTYLTGQTLVVDGGWSTF